MVPPPATPNSHRFSTSKHPRAQVPSRSQQLPTPRTTSSQQFASTPRFAFASSRQTQHSNSAAQPSQFSSPLLPRRPPGLSAPKSAPKSDDIEEPSSNSETNSPNPHPATDSRTTRTETIEDANSPPPPSSPLHKRRRIHPISDDVLSISSSPSPAPPTSTPPPQDQSHPLSSPNHHSSPPPPGTAQHPTRFILSKPHSSSSPSLPIYRPPFTIPPRSPSPPPSLLTHPLFSPHRKGGPKFVTGGMAGCVRDWVVDVATGAGVPGRMGKEGGWERRVVVEGVRDGERVTLVEEKMGDEGGGESGRWMLVGRGEGDGENEVRRGQVVGVRGPVWDVEIEGKRWNVGVDWGIVT